MYKISDTDQYLTFQASLGDVVLTLDTDWPGRSSQSDRSRVDNGPRPMDHHGSKYTPYTRTIARRGIKRISQ